MKKQKTNGRILLIEIALTIFSSGIINLKSITNFFQEYDMKILFAIQLTLITGLIFCVIYFTYKTLKNINYKNEILNRKNQYLTRLLFTRTSLELIPPKNFESEYYPLIDFKTNSEKENNLREYRVKGRILDYERQLLVDYFVNAYADSMTKNEIEKEITSLYNEPFEIFKQQ